MIWGVRSCLSACAYTTTSTVETAWTMWYYYSLFAYLITLHTNNFSNATVYIVIIILCSVGGLPDRYVITFMRLMSPFYYKFVFTDIQIPQWAVLIPKDPVLKRMKEELVRNLYMRYVIIVPLYTRTLYMVYGIVIPFYVRTMYMRYDIYIPLFFEKLICTILH